MTAREKREFRPESIEKSRRRQFLDDLCASWGMERTRNRRRRAAIVYDTFGEKQCRTWLKQAAGNYRKWARLTRVALKQAKGKGGKTATRKAKARLAAESRQRAVARREEALNRIAGFTQPRSGKRTINATVNRIDRKTELATLKKQLLKTESQSDRASEFKRESLKRRIALLEAQINSPKI